MAEARWGGWAAAVLLLPISVAVNADVPEFARFHLLRGKAANSYELDVQLPFVLTAPAGEQIALPAGCLIASGSTQAIAGHTSAVVEFACTAPIPRGASILVPWGKDGGVFTSSLTPGGAARRMLPGSERGVTLPFDVREVHRPLTEVAAEYAGLGIVHILEGLDHLAFVLCLCLLVRGATLLWLVTAFTVGHSISLASSFLGVVAIPVPPVEATIALSIAFMAREALVARRGHLRYMTVAAGFGLLHGLGFASALGDLGVAAGERIAGLIFFNAGVEVGQLMFVAAVTAVMGLAGRIRIATTLRTAALHSVGILAVFWTCERVTAFAT